MKWWSTPQLLKTFYEYDRQAEDSTATIKEFGVKTPPVKMLWANMGILLMTVLAGMLISLNIVDEKMDNTVSAINLTPVSRDSMDIWQKPDRYLIGAGRLYSYGTDYGSSGQC